MSKALALSRSTYRHCARPQNTQLVPPVAMPRRKLLYVAIIASLSIFSNMAVADVGATALPTGGAIAGGSGSISQSGATTTINQASSKLALNWNSFNIGSKATVRFVQPSSAAIALNRVVGQNASEIFGHLDANGQVFLINPQGILFGPTAQLNVGGLVASTLGMTSSNFMAGKFDLNANGSVASVVNEGLINAASGGSVSLLGGQVANDGLIVANYGEIDLDGTNQAVLNFGDNGLINVQITGKLKQKLTAEHAAVVNSGTLQANSGTVILQASAARNLFTNLVNNTGTIVASGINTNGGVVRLIANGGNTLDSGTINATGTQGGKVQLLSDQDVGVTGDVNVSGAQGGGSINVGGGPNIAENLPTAEVSYIGPNAILDANATQSGNGGSVMVWGNEGNNFYGTITATGGVQSGNGGQVETSAPYGLNVNGNVDVAANAGDAGSWLLDPYYDVTIDNTTTGAGITTSTSGSTTDFTSTGSSSTIDNASINSALTSGADVYIFTGTGGTGSGSITLDAGAPIAATNGTSSLYLEAAGSIILNANISNGTATSLNLYLWANYGNSTISGSYTPGSDPTAAVDIGNTANANITTGGGNVDIETGAGNSSVSIGDGYDGGISTGSSGNLTINTGSIVQSTASSSDALVVGGVSSFDAGTTGAITLANADNQFTGAVSLTGGDVSLTNGTATDLGLSDASGTLDVNSNGALTQTGAVTVGGAATFTQNSTTSGTTQDVDLGTQANDFQGSVSVTTGSGSGAAINNLSLENAYATPGTLTLPVSIVGNLALDYTNAALSLPVESVGGSLDVTARGGITLGSGETTGGSQNYNDLVLLAEDSALKSTGTGGNIQFASTVDGAYDLKVDTGGLTAFDGVVGGVTPLTGLQVNSDTFSAGALNIGTGGLSVTTTGGGITQGGAFSVAGLSSFNAGSNAITLMNTGNDFTGAVSLDNSGSNAVTLDNGTNQLTLGSSSVGTGPLTVSATGGITQATGDSITQAASAGAATFNAGAGVLDLGNTGNDFTGAVSLDNSGSNAVTLDNGTNPLTLGSSSVGTGPLTVSATGGITQATGDSITQAASAGAAAFNAGAGVLDLGNT
ncbi:MAG: beta strand repeat-containing protein, partial [Acidithiobacillus sp.]